MQQHEENLEGMGDDIKRAFEDLTHNDFVEQTESKAEEIMERNEPGYSNLTGYAGTLWWNMISFYQAGGVAITCVWAASCLPDIWKQKTVQLRSV